MPNPGEPFNAADLAELFSVAPDVPECWWDNGEGPDYFEQETPEGIKRFSTAEAVTAFCSKHRCMRPSGNGASQRRRQSEAADDALIGGGEFSAEIWLG